MAAAKVNSQGHFFSPMAMLLVTEEIYLTFFKSKLEKKEKKRETSMLKQIPRNSKL